MKYWFGRIKMPSLLSVLLAFSASVLLILAFPDFEIWIVSFFALVPLFLAIEREKESFIKSAITGWIFGIAFFAGTCWWLTFAPINYGGIPTVIAYVLLLGAAVTVGLFPALFGGLFSLVLKRFGRWGIVAAPFLWTAIEYLRFWVTGNNWNAIAYSQAFQLGPIQLSSIGGIYLTGAYVVAMNLLFFGCFASDKLDKSFVKYLRRRGYDPYWVSDLPTRLLGIAVSIVVLAGLISIDLFISRPENIETGELKTNLIAIQPNVPMSGLSHQEWKLLRDRHVQLAEAELQKIKSEISNSQPSIVIFPESPMNFGWTQDREFQEYLRNFTAKNNVQVLFNATEPSDKRTFYNSAVLVNDKAEKIAQYDKIHLVPFGEYVPLPEPLASIVPSMVGNFEIGKEYDILPLGELKAGVMICFESHFPSLSRQYALNGSDIIVEMTNDGYLGPTPILRQHLANAVFRAVETNRPILRVTNVGISGYINGRGQILDATKSYTEDTRVWRVAKSETSQTFYVKYGDWFAWLCSLVSLVLLFLSFSPKTVEARTRRRVLQREDF